MFENHFGDYKFPQDLKTMSLAEMDLLCEDIRSFLMRYTRNLRYTLRLSK